VLNHLKAVWREDWTKGWSYVKLGVGTLLSSAAIVNEFVSVPEMHAYIDSFHIAWIGPTILILGAVTAVAAAHRA